MKRKITTIKWWIKYRIRRIKQKMVDNIPCIEWLDDMDLLI